ncbi:hypothetical protein OMR07_02835 [Methylobacterium organophilum]|nr:hypothetical protein [Methylobacterium organophilum]
MSDERNPVLVAVEVLRADDVKIEPVGDNFDSWIVGHATLTNVDVVHLAASRGLIKGDDRAS